MKNALRKITLCAVLATLSTLAFMLESLFPPIILPGARMGISNVFVIITLLFLGYKFAFIALAVKILIGSLFSGNLSSIMYSLPAGIISLTVQYLLLHKAKNVSIIATSIAGAVINTAIQNTVFCLVTATPEYLFYLPYLSLIATVSGFIVGLIVYYSVKYVPKKLWN
jgi:heptaprenyl diphosphate synthase